MDNLVRKTTFAFALTLTAWTASAAVTPVHAQQRTVAEIANYAGADRAAVMEAGARKEGKVLFYSVGGQVKPIVDLFQKNYPYVRLEVQFGQTAELARRIEQEAKANRTVADAMDLDDGALAILKEANVLQPYASPHFASFGSGAVEPGKLWASSYESYKGVGFNTKLISPDEAPNTYDDLLNPKWKGRMAAASNAIPTWLGAVLEFKGEDYVRKLGQQDITVYTIQGRALANLVVSGEVALSPLVYNSHMHASAQEGASVAWRPLEGVYAIVSGMALTKQAPHPHAAMLLIDHVLSKEGQALRVDMGYVSGRTDLPSPDKPKNVLYASQVPDLAVKFDQWSRLGQQVFGKGKAAQEKN